MLKSCPQAKDAVMASMVKTEEPTLPADLPPILPDNQLGMEETCRPVEVGVEISAPDMSGEHPDVGNVEGSDYGLGDEEAHEVLNWKFLAQDLDCDDDESEVDEHEAPQPSPVKSSPPCRAAAASPEKVPESNPSEVTQYGPTATNTGGGKGGVKRVGDFVDPYYHTISVPPPTLSASAIYNRLHRVFKRKKDGSFLLDDRWNEMWSDASGGRVELNSIFEKVGYNVDRVYNIMKKMFSNG